MDLARASQSRLVLQFSQCQQRIPQRNTYSLPMGSGENQVKFSSIREAQGWLSRRPYAFPHDHGPNESAFGDPETYAGQPR